MRNPETRALSRRRDVGIKRAYRAFAKNGTHARNPFDALLQRPEWAAFETRLLALYSKGVQAQRIMSAAARLTREGRLRLRYPSVAAFCDRVGIGLPSLAL